jgi:hypothetical protein
MNSRKRAISIRMSATDIASVKKLAKRLGVRDSDVIRCAVKMMMTKIGPLADATVRGRNLVPVFMESGSDLFRHFDIDAIRLENIINDGAAVDAQVDHDDIQLIAMNGVQRSYVKLRLSAIGGAHLANQQSNSHGVNGLNGANGQGSAYHGNDHDADGAERLDDSLRQYLYEKYVFRANGNGVGNGNGVAAASQPKKVEVEDEQPNI